MSYLDRLKARIAADPSVSFVGPSSTPVSAFDPSEPASVGSVGGSRTPVPAIERPFVGSVGASGRAVSEIGAHSIGQTPLPHPPTKPTKGGGAVGYAPQTDPNRCFVCGGRETSDQPFIAVLTERPGAHHWLHAACHDEHRRRCVERRSS